MSDHLRRAEQVVEGAYNDYLDHGQAGTLGATIIATLAANGLLAPAPLREEWRAYSPGRGAGYPDVSFAAALDEVDGQLQLTEMDPGAFGTERDWRVESRHVTPWLPVDRSEADGRAEQ